MTLLHVICIFLFTFGLGTVIGSFLNVVALRGLSGESIVLPPSKCPKCGNKLKPWHNIPILSYIFLGGKCAFCKEKISIQYPIVEALTGILLVCCLLKYGLTLNTLFIFILGCILIVMSVTDIREKVILAGHAWFLIIVGLVYNLILSHYHIQHQLDKFSEFAYYNSSVWTNCRSYNYGTSRKTRIFVCRQKSFRNRRYLYSCGTGCLSRMDCTY